MKRNKLFLFTLLVTLFTLNLFGQEKQTQPALEVIERATGKTGTPIKLVLKKSSETYFKHQVKNGTLIVEGSSQVALTRGFYDFVKSNKMGLYSWSGSNIQLPEKFKEQEITEVISPFKNHYMSNVVVYGYSKPYWDWKRWEQEIDWMVLHGINMPLALVGYEAILARVWKKMGLTDDEINSYFVGPAHLPWMRMGNISGIDGPLNEDWHKGQIDLQHKILKRMKSLGMKPICPGFPGFIPEAFKRIYPNLNIIQTHWGGAFCNWMVSPDEPIFSKISTEFIREWEKEFGKNELYLIDSFNEMEIPFPEKGTKERYELVASYGDKVYQSIKKANPNATWVMQGWMFGYQRYIWDYETLAALVSKVPDNKMMLLDLAVDYNKHFWKSEVNWEYYKGFYNKQWVYSVIPNMGGKVGMTGVLEFYANGHLEALRSENRGNLIAHGMAPEGIENNEVIYELLADAGWSDKEINLNQWLKEYSENRYGSCPPEIVRCWELLQESVYGTFTDHPRYNWQLRPGSVRNGTINLSESFFKAIESFVKVSGEFREEPLYMADLAELTSLYLGGKAELLIKAIDWQYEIGDTLRAEKFEQDFNYLLKGMDALLSTHPTLRLERWVEFAKNQAVNSEQRKQYEQNAKRIVTIWGPPVDDYSARVWSGLLRDYYLPRWNHYFASRKSNTRFNFAEWEKSWVASEGHSTPTIPSDIVNTAKSLVDYAAFIQPHLVPTNGLNRLGKWNVEKQNKTTHTYNLNANELYKIKSIRLQSSTKGKLTFYELKIIADGKVVWSAKSKPAIEHNNLTIPVKLPADIRGNNGVELQINLENNTENNCSGEITLLLN
ncbi:MAG: alpha-N-acetylglucosaminidase TIM-barrel domain-containing protein [Phocaeicola sp.]